MTGEAWLYWAVAATAEPLRPQLLELLDDAERRRLAAFGHPGAAQTYLLAHALCRLALSACHPQVAARHWHFAVLPKGKPVVQKPPVALQFSLSHCPGLAACVVQPGAASIGLDVEDERRPPLSERLVRQVATAGELQRLQATAAPHLRAQMTWALWCSKEAYLKGLGCGLHEAMQGVEVALPPAAGGVRRRSRRFDGGRHPWEVHSGYLTPQHRYAVARPQVAAPGALHLVPCDAAWMIGQIASQSRFDPP